MGNWIGAKTIVENDGVQKKADQYSKKFERFDDLWESLKWLLARKGKNLESLKHVEGNREYYLYKTVVEPDINVPSITIVYKVTDDEIEICGVKVEK